MACGPDCGIGKCDCDRFLEIWNLVFTQFDQHADGTRDRLARPNIDTGHGPERIAAVCQGKRSNFDCDLFQDIIQYAAELAGVKYSFSAPDTNDVDTALRVIADHARAALHLAHGTLPSNDAPRLTCCAASSAAPCASPRSWACTSPSCTRWPARSPRSWARTTPN